MIDCETLAFIDERVQQIAAVTASPGFTWGKSGNVSSGTFLLNDTVPSNKAGRLVPLKNGFITKVFFAAELDATCTLQILKRVAPGSTILSFTELTTVTLSAQRVIVETKSGVAVDEEDELATRISSGSCKNPTVGVIIQGSNI